MTLICGDATAWNGPRPDLVFTHPYAPLPEAVRGVPAIVNLYEGRVRRQADAERWVSAPLVRFGSWGRGLHNTVYLAGLPIKDVDIGDLVEEEFAPGRGWMPLDLPLRLLRAYACSGITVWDGFCGRGTIGKACKMLNMNYVGIDVDPERIAIARKYLGC